MFDVTFIDESWSIDAGAPEVFDLLVDVDRWPEWAGRIRSAARSGTGPLSPGETLTFTPELAVPVTLRSTIKEVRAPELLSWGVDVPGFSIEHRFELEPTGETCELRQIETATGILSPIGVPLKGSLEAFDRSLGDDLQNYFRTRSS